MTEISDTQPDRITWAKSDEGKAAYRAAWETAKKLSPETAADSVVTLDVADVGAIVWAAHQATAASEEDTEPAPAHLHSWTILGAQEVPPVTTFMSKPVPRTAALARCTNCGEPATRVLEGTWTMETFAQVDGY